MVSPMNLTDAAGSLKSNTVNAIGAMFTSINSMVTDARMRVMFLLVEVPFFMRYALLSSMPKSTDTMNKRLVAIPTGVEEYGLSPKPKNKPAMTSSDT